MKPIVNTSRKLLGQYFRLHVPPAYECLLFALSAHSWPQNLLTLRAYYQWRAASNSAVRLSRTTAQGSDAARALPRVRIAVRRVCGPSKGC
jgi:hypothetical protein